MSSTFFSIDLETQQHIKDKNVFEIAGGYLSDKKLFFSELKSKGGENHQHLLDN